MWGGGDGVVGGRGVVVEWWEWWEWWEVGKWERAKEVSCEQKWRMRVMMMRMMMMTTDGWMDGWMDGWVVDGWMDGWMNE